MASYCVFVRNSGKTFRMSDSLHDERVADHPKCLEVLFYCGVPLCDVFGKMFGTTCHFDTRAIPTSDDNVALMEAMAPLIEGLMPQIVRAQTEP